MRCTGVPQAGQGRRYRPWTAISGRNAVTLSGNPVPTSARSRAVHSVSVDRLVGAIMLGVLTYDGNLLCLEPPEERKRARAQRLAEADQDTQPPHGDPLRREVAPGT